MRIHEQRPVIRSASRAATDVGEIVSRYWDDLEETDELHPFLMTAVGGLLIPLLLTALLYFVIL